MRLPVRRGYADGNGKGTIVDADGTPILVTHWGCGCCDEGPTEDDIKLADEVVALINAKESV